MQLKGDCAVKSSIFIMAIKSSFILEILNIIDEYWINAKVLGMLYLKSQAADEWLQIC